VNKSNKLSDSNLIVNLQHFADGDPVPPATTDPKKILDSLDPAVKESITKYFGNSFKKEREDIERAFSAKYETLLKELQGATDAKATLEEKLQAIEYSKLTDQQKIEKQLSDWEKKYKDIESKHTKATESANKYAERYKSTRIDNAIRAAIAQSGIDFIGSSEDIKALFEASCKVNFVEEGEGDAYKDSIEIEAKITDKDNKVSELRGDPNEVFQKWISQPRNAVYVKSKLKPGGNSGNSYGGAGSMVLSLQEFQNMVMTEKDEVKRKQIYADRESGKIIIKR